MPPPLPRTLRSPIPVLLRTLLGWAGAFASLAGLSFLISTRVHSLDAAQLWVVGIFVCGSFSISMLLAAGICFLTTRSLGRALAEMQRGEYIVRWTYSPQTWDAHVSSLGRASRWIVLFITGFILLNCGLIAYGVSLSPDPSGHKRAIALVFAIGIALSALICGLILFFVHRRRRRVRGLPESIISPNAFYCGGEAINWNGGGNGLYEARWIAPKTPGESSLIQFTTGPSRRMKRAAKAADVAMLVVGSSAGVSNMRVIRRVPVPIGEEEVARKVCRMLMGQEAIQPQA